MAETKQNVVVFGGSGFLGSHVADALSTRGHAVTVFDRRPAPWLRSDQRFVSGDVRDLDQVERAVRGADVVYHFAAIADIEEAAARPLETIQVNVLGTTHVLEMCRRHGVGRFVFASTIYVYSDLGLFYRSSKQACEKIIEDYQHRFGLDFTILRFGSLYGPRAPATNSVQRYVTQALREGKIAREGTGAEIREYVHVLDAAEGSVRVLAEEFRNQFVMITGPRAIPVRELLATIQEIMEEPVEIEYRPAVESSHYEVTPYAYRPRLARKLVLDRHVELGQGVLDLLYETQDRLEAAGDTPRIHLHARPSRP